MKTNFRENNVGVGMCYQERDHGEESSVYVRARFHSWKAISSIKYANLAVEL